jgi:hypothetical protein
MYNGIRQNDIVGDEFQATFKIYQNPFSEINNSIPVVGNG